MITRIAKAILSRLRAWNLKRNGATISGSVWLQSIEVPRNHWDIRLGDGVALDRGITLIATGERTASPRIRIGDRSYINRHSIIDASERITIGKDCLIGPFCYLTDHDHDQSKEDASGQLQPAATLINAPTTLGDQVWLGAHVTILKGVTIGDHATVGAGSVVTHDIPAHATAVGNPARVIRHVEP